MFRICTHWRACSVISSLAVATKARSAKKARAKSARMPVFELTRNTLEADSLFDSCEYGELHSKLDELADEPEVEIQWRRARALREYANIQGATDARNRATLLRRALSAAEFALSLDGEHWAAHKWYAIMLGDVAELDGNQKLLEVSFKIKEHFERSIQLHPDPTTMYCIGIWHFRFTELSWLKRKAAALYYNVEVPVSSYEVALGMFKTREKTKTQPAFKSGLTALKKLSPTFSSEINSCSVYAICDCATKSVPCITSKMSRIGKCPTMTMPPTKRR